MKGSCSMTTSEQIKILCLRLGISVSELARQIGQTPQNFNTKLKRNTISQKEIDSICKIFNITHRQFFQLSTGEIIE
ncbi:helix-turn-helix domain-containing protein [Caproiciproducens sp. R2]|uniref:helix-turn-helix domain-containing protein n=1 Tax=Caproiciproducens sp. R2 TaxID=3435187 RepID=UPI0040345ABD